MSSRPWDTSPRGPARPRFRSWTSQVLDFVYPEDRVYAEAALEDIARHPGVTRTHQLRILDAWGRVRRVRVWGRNLLHHPVVRGIVLNVRDETEESQLREKIEGDRALFQSVLEALPGVVYQAIIPPRAAEVMGYPPEAFFNDPGFFFTQVHPEDRPRVEAGILSAYRDPGQTQTLTYRFYHGAKGGWIWLWDTLVYNPKPASSRATPGM